jgi:deoxyribodipyrimidine photo-lyase
LEQLQNKLKTVGATLDIYIGTVDHGFEQLQKKYQIHTVYANHDYEPTAIQRDDRVKTYLQKQGIGLITCKDQVIFEKDEVIKDNGKPYTVFTPYSKRWKANLQQHPIVQYDSASLAKHFFKQAPIPIPELPSFGFIPVDIPSVIPEIDEALIRNYSEQRDFPALSATSKLGVHLRFGTISIRTLVNVALQFNDIFLNELIWREFYQMILWHFPQVAAGRSFKPEYDKILWRHDAGEFEFWCQGKTGYPIVDAGMRELNATGFMHNRVRMIVASFLSKHLLLDWRLGEAYFAAHLLDFDLASNNGGWQWAAGCGCDAAPYFRIFNPYLQTQRFDPQHLYIKKWVPEYLDPNYPNPIVIHEEARKRCLEWYGRGLGKSS